MLLKCYIQYVSKFGNYVNNGHKTGKVQFLFQPKEGQCQKMFKLPSVAFISHASNIMLKILQARFQQYMNQRLPDIQARFQNHKGIRDQVINISWIMEKAKEFHKNTYFCFIDYTKAFDHVDHNKLWKILKEMEVPDHLICILRNLCVGQEATVRTRYGTNNLVQNWGMSMTRLYIATLLT